MIKQLRVYQLDDETPDLPDMEKVTKAYPARECQHLQQSTVGFREFESIPGCRVIQVNGSRHLYSEVLRFRRSVPKAVLDREVRKRVKARVDRGDEVSRQDKRLLKEEVNHEMLPKMPQLETVIPVVLRQTRSESGLEQAPREPPTQPSSFCADRGSTLLWYPFLKRLI